MASTTVANFIKQVRQEASKVTWGSRKELLTSTIVVLVMVFIASLFFLLVDGIVGYIITSLLGF